jgi:hypothetical protein
MDSNKNYDIDAINDLIKSVNNLNLLNDENNGIINENIEEKSNENNDSFDYEENIDSDS